MATLATRNEPPTITGVIRYQVLVRWASGGMADIYVARQTGTGGFGKLVALKVMRPELAQSDEFREMFLREARTAALLSHPGIVQTFDAAELNGRLYMALEFVRGETLGRLVEDMHRRGVSFPVPLALEIAREVATALHYAHTLRDLAGVPLSLVHRDVSHSNVMLTTEGGVKLIDFGIAKVRSVAHTTQTGVIKGKFAYMSPEQANHEELDPRSDVYSLGVVLWELLTGKRAHAGDSDVSVLKSVLSRSLEAPSGVRPELAGSIDALVMKAIARDRADRYATAAELADAISRVRSELYPGYIARNDLQSRVEALFAKRGSELDKILAARDAPAVDLSSVDFEIPGVLPTIAPPTPRRTPAHPRIPPPPRAGFPLPPPLRAGPPQRTAEPSVKLLDDYAVLLREDGDPTVAYPDGAVAAVLATPAVSASPATPRPAGGRLRSAVLFLLAFVALGAAVLGLSIWAASDPPGPRTVTVRSTPEAEVYADGRRVGRSPASIEARTDRDTIVTVERPGYVSWRGVIRPDGTATELVAELARSSVRGTVVVRSDPPGARVHVDGELQSDTTPLVVTQLLLGEPHTIVLALDGHEPVVMPLDFTNATTRTVNATLVPLSSGYLAATCAPGACEVRVDGHPVGSTPLSRHRLLAARAHRVELVQNGRVVLDEEVTLAADEERTLMADISAVRRERRTRVGDAESPAGSAAAGTPAAGDGTATTTASATEPAGTGATVVAAAEPSPTPTASGTAGGAAAASKTGAASTGIRNIMGRYLRGGSAARTTDAGGSR